MKRREELTIRVDSISFVDVGELGVWETFKKLSMEYGKGGVWQRTRGVWRLISGDSITVKTTYVRYYNKLLIMLIKLVS